MRRICKYCGITFDTDLKHSKVCEDCKDQNHKAKIMNNLFIPTRKVYA